MNGSDSVLPLPVHIGVIMDGNGRWAQKRGLPRTAGHAAGVRTFRRICRHANKIGIRYMTFYTFSTENWCRPKEEVDALMQLLTRYLKDAKNFLKENIRCRFVGDRSMLSEEMQGLMADCEATSASCTGLTVILAVNYGGRDEILRAARKWADGHRPGAELSEKQFSALLDTAEYPDPDLIIRPSGEYRLSNFLTWQSAYAELWFSDILWPDFKTGDLDEAIHSFQNRDRRFGGI